MNPTTRTLLRGARVVTMAGAGPDAAVLDIVVDGDHIADVGPNIEDGDSEIVTLDGRVVIPGLINAHLHTWQTALRCVGADWTLLDYVVHAHLGVAAHYRPHDLRIGTLFGALSQIDSGTTTLGDWSHNLATAADVDAALDGLHTAGIRAVFFDGSGYRDRGPHPLHDFDRTSADLGVADGLITAALAVKGPQYSSPQIALADLRAAKERNVLVSMHHSGGAPAPAWHAVVQADLVGANTNVVHGGGLDDEWLRGLSTRGATFTITPESELRLGPEPVIANQLARLGLAPSLGTDVDIAVPGDILTAARILLTHQRSVEHERIAFGEDDVPLTTAKDALAWATVEGARALGLSARVGRIEPGMQADLVVIDATAPNLWPAHDPIAAALHANAGNIEAVMIAGRWRKRDHHLVDVDMDTLRHEIAESAQRLLHHLEPSETPSQLAVGTDQAEAVDTFIAELRETHRRRPRLQQEFDRARLP